MKRVTVIFAILATVVCSCSKPQTSELSQGKEIGIAACNSAITRAAKIFEDNASLSNTAVGGGNMTLQAYWQGTNNVYLSPIRVYYFVDDPDNPWRFREGDNLVKKFWPPEDAALDFFAYMPWSGETGYYDAGHISGITYTNADGPTFTCNLPLTNAAQEGMKEFIYAFTGNVRNSTDGGWGRLNFCHPFALVNIKLDQGHRNMTINSVTFKDIYNQGTYHHAGASPGWTPEDTEKDLVITIGKIIPDDINFGAAIDGPFFVMPQTFGGGTQDIEISTTWEGENSGNPYSRTINVSISQWQPGKAYTYTLNLGDIQEEIMFTVYVEEWDIIDYHIPVDVE